MLYIIARPLESQLKLEGEFHRVPYNQTFDFVTGQFVKILTPSCLWRFWRRPVCEDFDAGLFVKNVDNS